VDTFLDTPLEDLANEIEKLDPDDLVRTGAATARALARRDGFVDEIEAVARTVLAETEGRSLGSYLADAHVNDEWRVELEAAVVAATRDFVATDEFRGWLARLLT
jgi:hypothetical protein